MYVYIGLHIFACRYVGHQRDEYLDRYMKNLKTPSYFTLYSAASSSSPTDDKHLLKGPPSKP